MSGQLIISGAGSGKTTYIVKRALEKTTCKVLVTTFTDANALEIEKKFYQEIGYIPPNVTIQPWFSFLLEHGIRPFQGCLFDGDVRGLLLVNERSGFRYLSHKGPVYWGENDFDRFYFDVDRNVYSDKIAKLVIRCNEKSNGAVKQRISKIFGIICVDEVQDLAGYDLEILKELLSTTATIVLVGDPRQVTYHTHNEAKYKKYADGCIESFIQDECSCSCSVEKNILMDSYRCRKAICDLANFLYPSYIAMGSEQSNTDIHEGIYWVRNSLVDSYLSAFQPMQLRYDRARPVNDRYPAQNMGESKGITYEHVLIYPTSAMLGWFKKHSAPLAPATRSKLYVAITRAKFSVGIVLNDETVPSIAGILEYLPT